MPQISAAFSGWMEKITLLKHTETVVNGFVQKNDIPICFQGTIQPLSPRALMLKPEGQRSWEWLQIHAFATAVDLLPGDYLTFGPNRYKVTEAKNYGLNGYFEYHMVRDFQTGGTA